MAVKSVGLGLRTVGSLLKRHHLFNKIRTKHQLRVPQAPCESSACLLMLSTEKFSAKPRSRNYSHHPPFPYPEIRTQKSAKSFVLLLDEKGRTLLLDELNKLKTEVEKAEKTERDATTASDTVTRSVCMDIVIFHGIPFIGFGILDNMIMIIAGEYIDVTIGMALGISTMAAAALGNLISDLAGIGTAGYVELMATKVGVRPPDLTKEQAHSWQVRWSVGLGRGIGITIGCIIGMFPLLFFDNKSDDPEGDKDVVTKDAATQVS